MFGRKARRIATLRTCVDQLAGDLDAARGARDAYQRAATSELGRVSALRELLDETRTDAALARRAEIRAVRQAREAHRANEVALRRIERLQRAVARYRAEYERSRQEQGVAR